MNQIIKPTNNETDNQQQNTPCDEKREKEIKDVLREHLLDQFVPAPKNIEINGLKINQNLNISFTIDAKDYLYTAPYIEINTQLKDYSAGVTIKKPFILKVLSVQDKFGFELNEKNIRELKIAKNAYKNKSLNILMAAQNDINCGFGEEEGQYTINCIIKFETNPDYGNFSLLSNNQDECDDDELLDENNEFEKIDCEDDNDFDDDVISDKIFKKLKSSKEFVFVECDDDDEFV